MSDTPDILKTILAKKDEEVARRKLGMPIANLEEIASGVEKPRGFYNELRHSLKSQPLLRRLKKPRLAKV